MKHVWSQFMGGEMLCRHGVVAYEVPKAFQFVTDQGGGGGFGGDWRAGERREWQMGAGYLYGRSKHQLGFPASATPLRGSKARWQH